MTKIKKAAQLRREERANETIKLIQDITEIGTSLLPGFGKLADMSLEKLVWTKLRVDKDDIAYFFNGLYQNEQKVIEYLKDPDYCRLIFRIATEYSNAIAGQARERILHMAKNLNKLTEGDFEKAKQIPIQRFVDDLKIFSDFQLLIAASILGVSGQLSCPDMGKVDKIDKVKEERHQQAREREAKMVKTYTPPVKIGMLNEDSCMVRMCNAEHIEICKETISLLESKSIIKVVAETGGNAGNHVGSGMCISYFKVYQSAVGGYDRRNLFYEILPYGQKFIDYVFG
jgi:hypothetical protein